MLSFAKDKMIFQYNKVLMYLNITMTEISILIRRGTLVFQSRANLNYIIKVLPSWKCSITEIRQWRVHFLDWGYTHCTATVLYVQLQRLGSAGCALLGLGIYSLHCNCILYVQLQRLGSGGCTSWTGDIQYSLHCNCTAYVKEKKKRTYY